ncbi:MAG: glycosyltransferase family 4 protein [Deltaproteobacteria bacterium]|nr:glycosyltransferase family 4 protein [Deltaproteobacteria bacterium]
MKLGGFVGKRILFVAPRYHDSIVGGADQYTRALAWELSRAGASVRVLTSRSVRFEPRGELGIVWRDDLPAGEDTVDGIPVRRFGVWSPPERWAESASARVRAQLDRDTAAALRTLGRVAFGAGWYGAEPWGEGRFGRWSSGAGEVALPASPVTGLTVDALSLTEQRVTVVGIRGATRETLGAFELPRERWCEVVLDWDARPFDTLRLEGSHRFVPGAQDPRTLSFVASAITIRCADGSAPVLGARDRAEEVLDSLDDEAFARTWRPLVEARPRRLDFAYAALRGPLSPGLAAACFAEACRADAIVASGFPFVTMHLALAAGRRAKVPVYALPFFHDRDLTHHWRHLYGALRGARSTLALSRFHERHVAAALGARTCYVGASSPHWSLGRALPDAPPPSTAEAVGSGDHVLRVAFVGRLTHSKGVATAVEAVRLLRARGHDVRLCVIGPDESHGLGTGDGIERLGTVPVERLQEVLAACDALVLPSRHESFGLVVIEAWAAARPVLADGASGSLRTLISDGVDGYLCSGAEAYAARLAEWLADPARRLAMGAAGRREVEAEHRWQHVVARFAELLAPSSATRA